MYLEKYKQNLSCDGKFIYSYNTKVAEIDHDNKKVIINKWYSSTTTKHINYVAKELGFETLFKSEE